MLLEGCRGDLHPTELRARLTTLSMRCFSTQTGATWGAKTQARQNLIRYNGEVFGTDAR